MKGVIAMKSLFIITLMLFPFLSFADCEVPSIPNQFTLNERIISFTTTFDLQDDDGTFGKIEEKFLKLTRSFNYTDSSGYKVAEAREKPFSWGVQVDVFDCQGQKIGTIKENILKSLFKASTTYTIENVIGNVVAVSNKVDIVATSFTLTDPSGKKIATLKRPMINLFGDNWNVKVYNHDILDPRILVMIGAYKTSRRSHSK